MQISEIIDELKKGHRLLISNCETCGYPIGYVYQNGIYLDNCCDCVKKMIRTPIMQSKTMEDIERSVYKMDELIFLEF